MSKGVKKIRKSLDMAEYMHEWYSNKAGALNIPTSALMIIALNEYMRQDNALNFMDKVKNNNNFSLMEQLIKIDSNQGK